MYEKLFEIMQNDKKNIKNSKKNINYFFPQFIGEIIEIQILFHEKIKPRAVRCIYIYIS